MLPQWFTLRSQNNLPPGAPKARIAGPAVSGATNVCVRLQHQRHARINTLVAAPLTLPVAAMPKTRSPWRSPNRKFDWVEHSPTQLTRVALTRSASPASGDFGVNGIHRVRTAWIVVNHQTANGIQEVIGYSRPGAAVTPRRKRGADSHPLMVLPFRQRPQIAPSRCGVSSAGRAATRRDDRGGPTSAISVRKGRDL